MPDFKLPVPHSLTLPRSLPGRAVETAKGLATRLPAPVRQTAASLQTATLPRLDLPGMIRWPASIAFFGYSQTGFDGDTTNQEDIFEVSPITGVIRRITDGRLSSVYTSDRDPAWSANRSRLAIHRGSEADPESRLVLISRSSGAVVDALGIQGHTPRWLDTGTLLFLNGIDEREEVFCVDLATRTVRRITDVGAGASVNSLSWHPSAGLALGVADDAAGQYAVCVAPAAAVGAARAAGGSPIPRAGLTTVTGPTVQASSPDWSPTADRIAVTTWEAGTPSRVGYLTVATGAITLVPPSADPALNDAGAVFSPDGATLAFTRGNEDEWSEIWLWTRARLRPRLRQLTDDSQGRFKGSLDW